MLPAFPPGSQVAIGAPDVSGRPFRPGDVVAFRSRGKLVVHRVVSITEEGLITQGDNRGLPDNRPVAPERVEGRVLLVRQGSRWIEIDTPPQGSWWRNRLGFRLRNYIHRASNRCRTLVFMTDERFEKQKLGQDIVVHDRTTGQVHVLNETAALAWEKFHQGLTMKEVENCFREMYPGTPAREITKDVSELYTDLLNRKLIDPKEGRLSENE
ncbi:MAG: PqqD family peptide modification chaperone [Candidatus Sumerlaeia bacterium]|nr:PqqD family peptide modification chaperone [Candidatus Sumerlaeia bacterium]